MKTEIVLSIVIAIATVCYTIISLMLWIESQRQRKFKTTPKIIAFLKSSETSQYIKNIGEGCAKNVRFNMIHDYNLFSFHEPRPLSENYSLKHGIEVFPSQYEVKIFINFSCACDLKSDHSFIDIEIEYEDLKSNMIHDNYKLPLKQITSPEVTPPDTFLGQIACNLEQILNEIKKTKEE